MTASQIGELTGIDCYWEAVCNRMRDPYLFSMGFVYRDAIVGLQERRPPIHLMTKKWRGPFGSNVSTQLENYGTSGGLLGLTRTATLFNVLTPTEEVRR